MKVIRYEKSLCLQTAGMGVMMSGGTRSARLGIFLNAGMGIAFMIAAVIVVISVNYGMRQQALIEAQSKARIILDRNLATRTYFSKIMKPSIFAWSELFRTEEKSAPTWMSSNYTIHEIEKYFKSFDPSEYLINYPTASGRGSRPRIPITPQTADNKSPWDLKVFALNARSHENEADEYERAFLGQFGADKKLESESTVRKIGGKPYLVFV